MSRFISAACRFPPPRDRHPLPSTACRFPPPRGRHPLPCGPPAALRDAPACWLVGWILLVWILLVESYTLRSLAPWQVRGHVGPMYLSRSRCPILLGVGCRGGGPLPAVRRSSSPALWPIAPVVIVIDNGSASGVPVHQGVGGQGGGKYWGASRRRCARLRVQFDTERD